MSFVYPAGLWALLGVLALLAAHFIRRRYAQRTVPSAYLWRLSERFLMRMEPAQRARRAILLALQVLCVALCALLIAQPLVVMPGAQTAYVAVLDASGSMQIADTAGETRFARACRAIEEDAAALPWGSRVSVVLAGDEARLAVEDTTPGAALHRALETLVCDWGAGDLSGAMAICEDLLASGGASQVCLYTDRDVEASGSLSAVSARSAEEWNVCLSPVTAERTGQGMRLRAQLTGTGRDADVLLGVLVDGAAPDAGDVTVTVGGEAQDGLLVHLADGETAEVSVLVAGMKPESSAVLCVQAQDGLLQDNEVRFCGRPSGTTRVLLTGGSTYFLRKALSVFGEVSLECAEACEDPVPTEYDLYVYNGCMPGTLPEDGAVFLIDPPAAPEDTGVVLGETLMGASISAESGLPDGELSALTANLTLREASAARFREVVSCGRMTPVLRCGEMPLLLAGRTAGGGALLLLACDIQETNLPLTADFVALLGNALDFCAPQPLEAQQYLCGDAPALRRMASCGTLYLQNADRSIREVGAQETQLTLREPGAYALMAQLADGRERLFSFAVHMPPEEGTDAAEPAVLHLGAPNAQALAARERHMPATGILAALLLLLVTVEWMVDERERV